MRASNVLADNQDTTDCASNPWVDGSIDDALCCKLKDKCNSLYITGLCASNALADNQGIIACTSNSCVDGDADDALCCKLKAKCSSLTLLACVHLMYWQTIKLHLIAQATLV